MIFTYKFCLKFIFMFLYTFCCSDGSIRQWTIESLNGKKYFNKKLLYSSRSNIFTDLLMDVTPQSIVIGVDISKIEVRFLKSCNIAIYVSMYNVEFLFSYGNTYLKKIPL